MKTNTNIMLVDDNKIDLFVHQRVIKKFDALANMMVFSNPLRALGYYAVLENTNIFLKKDYPQIIFLDINMPEMSGFQFLDEIKNFKAITRNRPQIYILSSSALPEDIKMAYDNKLCDDYISKPLTIEKITSLLASPRQSINF